jgi:hypothetical protein
MPIGFMKFEKLGAEQNIEWSRDDGTMHAHTEKRVYCGGNFLSTINLLWRGSTL